MDHPQPCQRLEELRCLPQLLAQRSRPRESLFRFRGRLALDDDQRLAEGDL
jgi:hypothetical protein